MSLFARPLLAALLVFGSVMAQADENAPDEANGNDLELEVGTVSSAVEGARRRSCAIIS